MKEQRRILHLLQWKLKDIISWLPKIKSQGFNAIQVSPLQGTKDNGYEYWKLYQPINFRIGNSQIGSRTDLICLCNAAHTLGIEVYVDIVLRHIAGDNHDALKPHKLVNLPQDYYGSKEPCRDYHNREEYTTKCTGVPCLNYNKPEVQNMYTVFLDDLVACGVDGFRLDQLKHYKLPEEDSNFLHIFDKYKAMGKYVYGECIFIDKWLLDKYSQYMDVLTEGRPSDINKLVAKFESHDDYHEFKWTQRLSRHQIIDEWNVLINQCKFKNAIFFARPMQDHYTDSWTWEEIRKINLK